MRKARDNSLFCLNDGNLAKPRTLLQSIHLVPMLCQTNPVLLHCSFDSSTWLCWPCSNTFDDLLYPTTSSLFSACRHGSLLGASWQPGPSALPRLSCKVFEELAFSNLFLHLQWLHYSEYLVYKGCTLKVTSLAQTCRLRQSDIQMVLGSKSHNSKGKKSLTGVKDVVSVLILPPQSAP